MATIYRTNGTIEEVTPKNGKYFKLKELQEIVGGYIECIDTIYGNLMVLNEEGKIIGLPYNNNATCLIDIPDDYIVGDVLVCNHKEVK